MKSELNVERKITVAARIVAGSILIVYGLDKLVPFMWHPTSLAEGIAFKEALKGTGYLFYFIGLCEMLVGVLLLSGYFIPLALLILAPLCANFLLYHAFLEPKNIGGAVLLTVTGVLLARQHREIFKEFLKPRWTPKE